LPENIMSCTDRKIDYLRRQIAPFDCVPGCHDCCGPVTASAEELSRLPRKSAAQHAAALQAWNCVYLGPQGCEVYAQRPLICRLFGSCSSLPCPHGRRPLQFTAAEVEEQVHTLIASTRQRLL
jgi:Fe-S-cluster containining protein